MALSRQEQLLSGGRIGPLFLRYALPGVVSMVFVALQQIADGIIVGRFIGSSALAAVNIACPAYTVVTAIAMILGVGTEAQMGIHLGEGDYSKAKTAFKSGLYGMLFFAALGTIFINAFAPSVARFLGADEALMSDSIGYIHGVMPWLAGVGCSIFFDDVLKALGRPKPAMWVMVGVISLNIVLSTIFVLVLGMGTFGAGLGTGISYTLGGILDCIFVVRELSTKVAPRGRLSFSDLGHIFYNGSSEGITELSFGVMTFLFNITMMRYAGSNGVAAFTLANYILFVGVSVMIGISNGVIPILSYNHGAGAPDRVRRTFKVALRTNYLCGAVFILIMWIFGRQIIGLFVSSSEPQVLLLTVHAARIVSLEFLFCALTILSASYFTALDKPGLSLLISGSRGLVLPIVGIFTLPLLWGTDGIWLTIVFSEALSALLSLGLLAAGRRIF